MFLGIRFLMVIIFIPNLRNDHQTIFAVFPLSRRRHFTSTLPRSVLIKIFLSRRFRGFGKRGRTTDKFLAPFSPILQGEGEEVFSYSVESKIQGVSLQDFLSLKLYCPKIDLATSSNDRVSLAIDQ